MTHVPSLKRLGIFLLSNHPFGRQLGHPAFFSQSIALSKSSADRTLSNFRAKKERIHEYSYRSMSIPTSDFSSEKAKLLLDSRRAFVDWAKENAIPISEELLRPIKCNDKDYITGKAGNPKDEYDNDQSPFLQAISNAVEDSSTSVVLLSEGFHNCKEMMILHHHIIRNLVTHHGFRLVASESGLPESRDIADYVIGLDTPTRDVPSEKEELWQNGLNKMYSAWEEGRGLIEWIKAFNERNIKNNNQQLTQLTQEQVHSDSTESATNHGENRNDGSYDDLVHYCGLDIGGFYSNWKRPISKIQRYLQINFPEFERQWSEKVNPILDIMGEEKARFNYQNVLSPIQKSTLAILLDELVDGLNSHAEELDGDVEFEWARQAAISMQLAENYYRNFESMQLSSQNPGKISKYSGLDGREIAMAQNLRWRMNVQSTWGTVTKPSNNIRLGPIEKAVVINHVIHTKTATQYQDEIWGHFVPMGQMIQQMLLVDRKRVFNMGIIYGGGSFWNKWQKPNERFVDTIQQPRQQPLEEDGLEVVMQQISKEIDCDNYYLRWEMAPAEAWLFLNEATTIRENDYFIRANPLEWNGCIYLDRVSPATACC